MPRPFPIFSAGIAAACAVAVLAGAWACFMVNREPACARRESIASFCNPPAAGSAQALQSLRDRIERNPGDANAYTELALTDASPQKARLEAVANELAPREPNLMLRRAAAALDRGEWGTAVPLLIELADHYGVAAALTTLDRIVQAGQGALLVPYLAPGNTWLPQLLGQIEHSGRPRSGALPLVIAAFQARVIETQTALSFVRALKQQQQWADAYGLWLAVHGTQLPVLFNGSFDRPFEAGGFDWEVPHALPASRQGVVVERRRTEQRGSVLDLQFTGRPLITPMVKQDLFIAPGRYRLRGDRMTRKFRSDAGLVWTVRCGETLAGTSLPLRETEGYWQAFDFEFTITPACGLVASLQLEPTNPAETATGARGRVAFDAFFLERMAP